MDASMLRSPPAAAVRAARRRPARCWSPTLCLSNSDKDQQANTLIFEDTMKKTIFSLLVVFAASTVGYAQQAGRGGGGQQTSREDGLDPTPIDPAKDPNVGMFINDYRNAKPRPMYG